MERLTAEELIEQAQEIVLQEVYDDSDVLNLNKINFFLAKHYLSENVSGNVKE
jgi:hypothetical protein